MSVHATWIMVSFTFTCVELTYLERDTCSRVVGDHFSDHVNVPVTKAALVEAQRPVGVHLGVTHNIRIVLRHLSRFFARHEVEIDNAANGVVHKVLSTIFLAHLDVHRA